MLYDIIVPAGVSQGETFQVHVGATDFDVVVPDGCGEGMKLELELPSIEDTNTQAMIEVEVPDGCFAGDEIMVETPDGGTVAVVVPEGSSPGTLLSVALPEPAQPRFDKVELEERPSTPTPTSVRATFGEMLSKENALIQPAEVRDFGPDGFDFDDSYLIQRSDGSYTEGFLQVRGSRVPSLVPHPSLLPTHPSLLPTPLYYPFLQEYDAESFLYRALIPRGGFKWVSSEQIELNTVHI